MRHSERGNAIVATIRAGRASPEAAAAPHSRQRALCTHTHMRAGAPAVVVCTPPPPCKNAIRCPKERRRACDSPLLQPRRQRRLLPRSLAARPPRIPLHSTVKMRSGGRSPRPQPRLQCGHVASLTFFIKQASTPSLARHPQQTDATTADAKRRPGPWCARRPQPRTRTGGGLSTLVAPRADGRPCSGGARAARENR